MKRSECLEVLHEAETASAYFKMHSTVCFHMSPMDNKLETRIIYSPDFAECSLVKDEWLRTYKEKFDLPFCIYIDGELYCGHRETEFVFDDEKEDK